MKEPLHGLISRSLADCGVEVATYVPGHGAVEIFEEFCKLKSIEPFTSFNEEISFTIAFGAAIAGKRSCAVVKSHGLAKAANAVIVALSGSVCAGCVIIALDDKEAKSSDNIFDFESFLAGLKIPYSKLDFEKAESQIAESYELSERFSMPVVLTVDSEIVERERIYQKPVVKSFSNEYKRDISRRLVCPPLAQYQRRLLEARLSGGKLPILDEADLPQVPDGFPPRWKPILEIYRPFFDVFKRFRGNIVAGDTSLATLFAFPPYSCVDMTSHIGCSIPLATGASAAGFRDVWALTGDFAFLSAGANALIEAAARKTPIKIVLFRNGAAAATGGQAIEIAALDRILSAYRDLTIRVDSPDNQAEIEKALEQVKSSEKLAIIALNYI